MPLYQASLVSLTTLTGGVAFQEFRAMQTTNIFTYAAGLLVATAGLLALSRDAGADGDVGDDEATATFEAYDTTDQIQVRLQGLRREANIGCRLKVLRMCCGERFADWWSGRHVVVCVKQSGRHLPTLAFRRPCRTKLLTMPSASINTDISPRYGCSGDHASF